MARKITSVNWTSSNLPSGLSIGSANGTISGTPNVQPGSYTANVTVTTNYGTDTKPITINVAIPENWMPIIDAGQVIEVIADEPMNAYTVTGTNVVKDS